MCDRARCVPGERVYPNEDGIYPGASSGIWVLVVLEVEEGNISE